jgi:RHS repeat-associated protein
VVEDTGRRVDYTYDALDRLTEEDITDSVAGNRTIHYTYDPVGNRLTMVDSVGGETDYTYDANDRLLTETTGGVVTKYTYDNNGNSLSKFTSAVDQALYEWDFENRLIGAKVTDSTGTSNIAYQYNPDGIRVSSTVNGVQTRYLIDTVQPYAEVLEEYSSGGVINVSYVYGWDLISQNRAGVKSFYAVDGLGSTRALTDAKGNVTDRYVYDAFGRMIAQTGSTVNLYLFAGQQRDPNVGLDYLRARYLNVETGRFYGRDQLEGVLIAPVTLHRFLYANSNPAGNTDPTGDETLSDTGLAVSLTATLALASFGAATALQLTNNASLPVVLAEATSYYISSFMKEASVLWGPALGALDILKQQIRTSVLAIAEGPRIRWQYIIQFPTFVTRSDPYFVPGGDEPAPGRLIVLQFGGYSYRVFGLREKPMFAPEPNINIFRLDYGPPYQGHLINLHYHTQPEGLHHTLLLL